MYLSTIFGCHWLNSIILTCSFNPLSIPADSTTLSTKFISFPTETLQETFIYDISAWPKLEGLFNDQRKYGCSLGMCRMYLSDSATVQRTYVEIITAVNQTTSMTSASETHTFISSTTTMKTVKILSTFKTLPDSFQPISPSIKHPRPSTQSRNKDDEDVYKVYDLLDRVLIGTTGFFSFSTFVAIVRCVCKKKKVVDKFLKYYRRKNGQEQQIAFYNPVYQGLEDVEEVETNAGEEMVDVDLGDGQGDETEPLNLSSFETTADSTSGLSTFFSPLRAIFNNSERLQRILSRGATHNPPRIAMSDSFFNV